MKYELNTPLEVGNAYFVREVSRDRTTVSIDTLKRIEVKVTITSNGTSNKMVCYMDKTGQVEPEQLYNSAEEAFKE